MRDDHVLWGVPLPFGTYYFLWSPHLIRNGVAVLRTLILGLFSSLVLIAPAVADDWSRFRGPNGSGVSAEATPTPTTWSPTEHLKWKVALPGEGVSCPIVVGDRVFVTTYSGYGFERGEQADLRRHLLCFDRKTGKTLWEKTIEPVLPEDPYSGMGVPSHGYASHTPASDGKRVYCFFGKTGVIAFDLDGKQLWHTKVGTESDPRRWGSSSSPIVVDGVVVVAAGPERRAIVGLDVETGKELWAADAEPLGSVYGTPVVAKIDAERTDIVIGAPYEIWGLNPKTGKVRWFCEAMDTDSFNTSAVVQDGVVYAIEGRSGGSIAIKAGGKGDVTKTNVLWTGRDANRFGTPVVVNGRIYFISNGIVNCIDASSGKKVFQSRLPGGRQVARGDDPPEGGPNLEGGRPEGGRPNPDGRPGGGGPGGPGGRGPGGFGGGFGGPGGGGGFGGGGFGGGRGGSDYSSPVAADGKIYFTTGTGDMHVIKAGDTFESLAVNRVTSDSETFAATPAISNGELFIRSNKHLYCVSGEAK